MLGARLRGCALLLFGVAAGLAACGPVLTSDTLLERGFGRALQGSHALTFTPASPKRLAVSTTAGDEGFWLTQAEVPAPFATPLAVGDRITITARDGQERQLEVIDMKAVGGSAPGIGPGMGAGVRGRLLLVSCRLAGEPSEANPTTVRFLIEAAAEQPMPRPAKAL